MTDYSCAGSALLAAHGREGGAALGMLAREAEQDWPPRSLKALVTAGGTYADYVSVRTQD